MCGIHLLLYLLYIYFPLLDCEPLEGRKHLIFLVPSASSEVPGVEEVLSQWLWKVM